MGENIQIYLGFHEYKNDDRDETSIASKFANTLNLTHHSSFIRQEDFFVEFSNILSAMDIPSIDGINTYFVCKLAQESNIKVLLSGLGGDEFFCGYSSFNKAKRVLKYSKRLNIKPSFGRAIRKLLSPFLSSSRFSKYISLFEYSSSYTDFYISDRCLQLPHFINIFDSDDLYALISSLNSFTDNLPSVQHFRSLQIQHYMSTRLPRDSDWSSMFNSIELRVPFVDIPFVKDLLFLESQGFIMTKKI